MLKLPAVFMASAALMVVLAGCGGPNADIAAEASIYQQKLLAGSQAEASASSSSISESPGASWWRLGSLLAANVEDYPRPRGVIEPPALAGQQVPVEEGWPHSYAPYEQRRGPAYPDDVWRNLGRDAKEMPAAIWDDTKATFTNPLALGLFVGAGAAGIAINATGVDEAVARRTDGHRQLSKTLDGIGGFGGSPAFHFPLAGVMYFTGFYTADDKLYETSKTLLNALSINGLITMGLKLAVRTESPNGDEFGWPSGHTSSSFTFATVMYRAYGPWVGLPLYGFASFVGYQRIDARNHDFSDVISGMLIGIAVGHAVSMNHEHKIFGMDVIPYVDAQTGAVGIGLAKVF